MWTTATIFRHIQTIRRDPTEQMRSAGPRVGGTPGVAIFEDRRALAVLKISSFASA
jgi:hypothetical protein